MAKWCHNARVLLEARYLRKNAAGTVIETPDAMLDRVAKHISKAEKGKKQTEWYTKFLEIMDNLEFLPNTPCLINSGRPLGMLSACFVVATEDSLAGIYEALKRTALISKMGGGVGISFSRLRPKDAWISTTSGVSSGPVSFMRLFDTSADVVKQGGVRRGANMGVLDVRHPDIEEFISCKDDTMSFQNFNISVALTDEFMVRALNNRWHWLVNPNNRNHRRRVSAASLFDKLCYYAWKTGDPGVIFIDTVNKYNPTPWYGRLLSTNPCSEIPLFPNESCNLGSIDISKFVDKKKRTFDWSRLEQVIGVAVRFLDNVITVNKYPYVKIKTATLRTRKIGLGIMGWADALIDLGIRYGSEESLDLADTLMDFMREEARKISRELSIERGFYPGFHPNNSKEARRNATLLAIAPTGSISILANCSSGLEPLFGLQYSKIILGAKKLEFECKRPDADPNVLVTAHDIEPEEHIQMQARFQKHVDNAVSKTLNLPTTATVADVKSIILLAHKLECKSVTVYREGSKPGAPLSSAKECATGVCEI